MSNSNQIRQGDVFLQKIDNLPEDAGRVLAKGGLLILAHGEVTGHLHGMSSRNVHMYQKGDKTYLEVLKSTLLRHGNPDKDWSGDHDTLKILPGKYQVVIQREYIPGGWRNVVD